MFNLRIFFSLVFISFVYFANARNYYFSSSSGIDSRSFIEAQSTITPWRSLNKLNYIFSSLKGGDSLLLKRGDLFYGKIIIKKSGLDNLPIVISAYGSGELPIISGFEKLSEWNFKGAGVYESNTNIEDSLLNMVVIDNDEFPMGRYPNNSDQNKGWLTISSYIKNNSINGDFFSPEFNWAGGEVVIRKKNFVIDRSRILSQTGNTLNYSSGSQYEPAKGFGYFIQNHIATLDQFGEWYFDPVSKKLNMFFGKKIPSDFLIKASSIDNLISVRKCDNIVFKNVALEGSNRKGFDLYYSKNIEIKNCKIDFSGVDAIDGYNTNNLHIESCSIINSHNNAIDLIGACDDSRIRNNIIKYTGQYAGMASNNSHSFSGININGNNNLVEYNEVDTTGYIGIRFAGNSVLIKNNYIKYFCFIKDDGGGIYTGNNDALIPKKDQTIKGNIILYGIGAREGSQSSAFQASGIYLDDNSSNINVVDNTVAYAAKAGIFLHNCRNIAVSNNTLYDNAIQLIVQKDAASAGLVRNNSITNNIFFSKSPSQFVASFRTIANDINMFGIIDSNYYSRPFDDNIIISTSYIDQALGKKDKYYDLEGWKSDYKKDLQSKKSPLVLGFYKENTTPLINKITNGNFDMDTKGVRGFKSKISWQNSGLLDGGYLQVVPSSRSSPTYIAISVGPIYSGKNYILKCSAKGLNDNDRTMGIHLRENGAPYSNLAPTIYRKISRKRYDYEIPFSATKDEMNALLIFTFNDPDNTYLFDNIQLQEVVANFIKPEDYFLFRYNSTTSEKKIAINGKYIDAKNKHYNNSITLPPFTSVILIKKD